MLNSVQKRIFAFTLPIVVLMIAFPPWEYFDEDSSGASAAGYHFILTPPPLKSPPEMFGVPEMRVPDSVVVRLDIVRLGAQLLIFVPFMLGLLFLLADEVTAHKMALGIFFVGLALYVSGFILWIIISI
jgi:hypothetical protein